jgi:hypothetical protein
MPKSHAAAPANNMSRPPSITQLSICGYKSIAREQTIAIRPLTILAGANSSGKSSMIQPLLLLKQTLEASYDPGPLLLNGPNLHFRSADEFLARDGKQTNHLDVSLHLEDQTAVDVRFKRHVGEGLQLQQVVYHERLGDLELGPAIPTDQLLPTEQLLPKLPVPWRNLPKVFASRGQREMSWLASRNRCFFELSFMAGGQGVVTRVPVVNGGAFAEALRRVIHLPALRGTPERAYPVAAVGATFPGTFNPYMACVIAHWQAVDPKGKLRQLAEDLKHLGLTWKVSATALDETQVELKVGRLPSPARGGTHDLVNLADVGFGLSQSLPVVTALLAAEPGQLVYIEQPELHLHPRAQVAMARVLANAANRGVQVVAETHSSLLLLGVQSLVAEGHLSPNKVMLHWFRRDATSGITETTSAELDEAGRFGDWPEDFDDVALRAESRYLDAAEARLAEK